MNDPAPDFRLCDGPQRREYDEPETWQRLLEERHPAPKREEPRT